MQYLYFDTLFDTFFHIAISIIPNPKLSVTIRKINAFLRLLEQVNQTPKTTHYQVL